MMQAIAAAVRPCPVAARPAAAGSAARRSSRRAPSHVVRAQSDEERAAALKAALEQAQSNPEVAAKMKQMEEAMANPAMQAQMSQMMSAMGNPAFMQKMAELREDPELKPVFEEIKTGGMAAMMKYMNDPRFLAKIGEKMGDLDASMMGGAPAAAAAPPPPPEVNNILDAAKYGDLEAIEDYMAIGKGDLADSELRTALHYAVAYDRAPAVKALLDNGADTTACDKGGNPPLHYAAGYGREECVRLLLAAGADITVTNDKGQTAAEVVKSEPRNPLNQNASLLAVLEGAAELASIQ
ncbi:hypothetical protein ABPG77_011064 [Micractinium sp. CCAP 211/92]